VNENFEDFNEEWAETFSVDRMYHMYIVWCKRNGKKAQASNNFREDLRRVMKASPTAKWDKVEGRTYRGYNAMIKENSEIRRVTDYHGLVDFSERYMPVPPLLQPD
jgi:phage/plasmid-associated DNA primase